MIRQTLLAVSVGDTTWDQIVLELPELEEMGPSLQDIVVHMELQNRVGLFAARVCISYKYDDAPWSQPADSTANNLDEVLPEVSAAGYGAPSAPYNDRTRLGRRRIRLIVQYHAKTNGAAGAKGEVTIGIACRPFCC